MFSSHIAARKIGILSIFIEIKSITKCHYYLVIICDGDSVIYL